MGELTQWRFGLKKELPRRRAARYQNDSVFNRYPAGEIGVAPEE